VSIDCGRELYVSSQILHGKQLYRDVMYVYGPVAPYFNALLFWSFGVRLEVLYWAGSLSGLLSGLLLYATGKRLGLAIAGCGAGAVVIVQGFGPFIFSYPLAYSFAAVYGFALSVFFLWCIIHTRDSDWRGWLCFASLAAACVFLLKLEIGFACYTALGAGIAGRLMLRSDRGAFARDLLATLPGVLIASVTAAILVYAYGFVFLTQQNIMSWPSSYFMKTYGQLWLANSGLSFKPRLLAADIVKSAVLAGTFASAGLFLKRRSGRRILLRIGWAALGVTGYLSFRQNWGWANRLLRFVGFPSFMPLFVALCAGIALAYFWKARDSERLAFALLLFFSTVFGFRILLACAPFNYPIFYNGPAVLSFLALSSYVVLWNTGASGAVRRSVQSLLAAGSVVVALAQLYDSHRQTANRTPLVTQHGTISIPRSKAAAYANAIAFMESAAEHGKTVLALPEEMGLYFFSGTECPTRVYQFAPGVVAPGKMMDDVIREIETKRVDYLLWSTRDFSVYGVRTFGVDYDQKLATYLRSHYHQTGYVSPIQDTWKAAVWQRNAGGSD